MKRLDVTVSASEAEDLREKVEFGVQSVLDVLRLAKSMLLALIYFKRTGKTLAKQRSVH